MTLHLPPPDGEPQYPHYPYADPGYWYPAGYPQPERRPGQLTAAAVLGFVAGGLLVLAGIALFTGASLVASLHGIEGTDRVTAELALDGFLDMFAAGLLIAGGILMLGRSALGRALYAVGAAVVVVEAVYWLLRWGDQARAVAFYAVLFGGLVVLGCWLTWTRRGSAWLAGDPVASPPRTPGPA